MPGCGRPVGSAASGHFMLGYIILCKYCDLAFLYFHSEKIMLYLRTQIFVKVLAFSQEYVTILLQKFKIFLRLYTGGCYD